MSIDLRRIAAIKPEGMSHHACKRRLRALDRVHGGILVQLHASPRSPLLVDYARLREVHPTWTERVYASRTELAEILARLTEIEGQYKHLKSLHNRLASRFKEYVATHENNSASGTPHHACVHCAPKG